MDLAVIAIVLSILSVVLSGFMTGWTVYRDAVQKPRFRVNIDVARIVELGGPVSEPYIRVQALNVGPVSNRINQVELRRAWWKRETDAGKFAILLSDYGHVSATEPSERIEVGDKAVFAFPISSPFASAGFVQIGVSDGYGRMHWVSVKKTKQAFESIKKEQANA